MRVLAHFKNLFFFTGGRGSLRPEEKWPPASLEIHRIPKKIDERNLEEEFPETKLQKRRRRRRRRRRKRAPATSMLTELGDKLTALGTRQSGTNPFLTQ